MEMMLAPGITARFPLTAVQDTKGAENVSLRIPKVSQTLPLGPLAI